MTPKHLDAMIDKHAWTDPQGWAFEGSTADFDDIAETIYAARTLRPDRIFRVVHLELRGTETYLLYSHARLWRRVLSTLCASTVAAASHAATTAQAGSLAAGTTPVRTLAPLRSGYCTIGQSGAAKR